MLPLKADFMPVSGFSLDEIPDQSRRAEGFFAAGRSVFREMWPHDAFVIEPAVASLAGDYLAGEPEAFERYKQDAKGSTALSRRLNSRKKEDYLPRFTREELESQGYAVHDAIEFEKDSDGQQRLSLPRFLVYTQSYEASGHCRGHAKGLDIKRCYAGRQPGRLTG